MSNPEHERILYEAERSGDASVSLSGFDLRKVGFVTCPRLNDFDLSGADLRDANLSGGHLKGANLTGANLARLRVGLGDFRDAKLANANLTKADLSGSVLVGADLSNANLTNAKLVKTRLQDVDFAGANLERADMRGAQGLTAEQLASAVNGDAAILDERMLASLGKGGDQQTARHGKARRNKKKRPYATDLKFKAEKPSFGDLFLLCGDEHPDFPPTGAYGFAEMKVLGVEQMDDYFAICVDGEPVIWLSPLVRGRVVEHHSGPFDGIRIELGDSRHAAKWSRCVKLFAECLSIPFTQESVFE